MRVKVKVKASPYRAVKEGIMGKVISRKFTDTVYEQVRVEFPNGSHWAFYPDELEFLKEED